jgi:signal transduction histidine kinase
MNTSSSQGTTTGRRRGPSILVRQLGFYLVFILLVIGVAGQLFFATARSHLENEIGGKLESVARIAARDAPLVQLRLIRVGADRSRMVLRLKQDLEKIREATGLLNLRVFRPDLTSLLDLDSSVTIGSQYRLPELGVDGIDRLRREHSIHTLGYLSPDGTNQMSAYAGLTDSTGVLSAIVGVVAGAAELDILERMRTRLLWIATGCAGLAGIAALLFARSITRPVRHIADVAERLGAGDYTARADVRTRDEVEVLATAVNLMAEQVRQRDAALKEMAASVAHEVRNPLNSIKLLLALLAEDIASGRGGTQQETLQTLEYEISKLTRFTAEFLTWSRPASAVREPIDPAALVRGVVDLAGGEARERGVELCVEEPPAMPSIEGDRQRLEQALLNLVINAIQASGTGGQVTVRVISTSTGMVAVVVDDSGPGVAAEHRGRLFEPFFTTRTDGTGLGLANADKIAREHGGQIRLDEDSGQGARFVLELPVGIPAL